MKRIALQIYFVFYMFVVVSHKVFMKGQPFLDFLCEVMLHSPRGKSKYGYKRFISKVTMEDVLEFFDRNSNHGYYDGEVEFLLKYCKSKRLSFLFKSKPFCMK
jgi:hypothetical protein